MKIHNKNNKLASKEVLNREALCSTEFPVDQWLIPFGVKAKTCSARTRIFSRVDVNYLFTDMTTL